MISDNRSKNGEKQLKSKKLSFRNILFTRFTDRSCLRMSTKGEGKCLIMWSMLIFL